MLGAAAGASVAGLASLVDGGSAGAASGVCGAANAGISASRLGAGSTAPGSAGLLGRREREAIREVLDRCPDPA